MTQKPRKWDFGELKSKTLPGGTFPQTSLEIGNRSVFILDPRLEVQLRWRILVLIFCILQKW